MYTIQSILTQLTDPSVVLPHVYDTLRHIDPAFAEEEAAYRRTVEALEKYVWDSVSPGTGTYIAAHEQKICAELLYAAWLGFQQNLECFQNPVNIMFLKLDYEDFYRENRMHTLPAVRDAWDTINAFQSVLSQEGRELTEGVIDFYCYLESVGYKLAHYFGFALADQFLGHVVPGYVPNTVTTIQYERELREYMKLDLSVLVGGAAKLRLT